MALVRLISTAVMLIKLMGDGVRFVAVKEKIIPVTTRMMSVF